MQLNTWNWHLIFSSLPGFTFVKELTLDIQNVIAPPKEKSSAWRKEVDVSSKEGEDVSFSDADSKTGKKQSSGEEDSEQSEGKTSDVDARDKNGSLDDSKVRKGIEADSSPRTKDTRRYVFCARPNVFWIASFLAVLNSCVSVKSTANRGKTGSFLQRRIYLGYLHCLC